MDLRHDEPLPSYAANGDDRQASADARAHDGPFVGRPWIGEQIRAGRGVHGGAGVEDEVVVAAVFRPRSRFGASWRGSPLRCPWMDKDNRIDQLIGWYASWGKRFLAARQEYLGRDGSVPASVPGAVVEESVMRRLDAGGAVGEDDGGGGSIYLSLPRDTSVCAVSG